MTQNEKLGPVIYRVLGLGLNIFRERSKSGKCLGSGRVYDTTALDWWAQQGNGFE